MNPVFGSLIQKQRVFKYWLEAARTCGGCKRAPALKKRIFKAGVNPKAAEVRSIKIWLPAPDSLDLDNWFSYPHEIILPQYLGNGMILNPEVTILAARFQRG